MHYDSLFHRHELFVAAATVGAHSNAHEGFRQRDVKFLIDLFMNWTESALQRGATRVQNNQVARYLEYLTSEGFARRLVRKGPPLYRLSRTGLLELLSRMVERPQLAAGAHFFFLFYFIRNYGPRITELVKEEGRQFPYALKLELDRLLDAKGLIERELDFARREKKKLDRRINDAEKTTELAKERAAKGVKFEDIVLEAQRAYPYELNSQRPLTELISSIPEGLREWELTQGNMHRVADLWGPERSLLECYIDQLVRAREAL